MTESPHVIFRTDASAAIGSGHFMRCLTLARMLANRGAGITFLCKHLPDFFEEQLAQNGFLLHRLRTRDEPDRCGGLAHSHWLGTSQETDARACLDILARSDPAFSTCAGKPPLCIVDHYALDACWESMMRASVSTIMVIDDLADRFHDCDILLDQNLIPNRQQSYLNKTPESCTLLLGPKYALLRDEFSKLRQSIMPRDGQVSRVLLFLGGVDRNNHTGLALRALQYLHKKLTIDVVIGAGNPNRHDVEALCKKLQARCHVQSTRMAELMARADFAIGAAGSASWERCCLALPSILFILADNQRPIGMALHNLGACVALATNTHINEHLIAKTLGELFDNPGRLRDMSRKAHDLVDGRGCYRVGKIIFDTWKGEKDGTQKSLVSRP